MRADVRLVIMCSIILLLSALTSSLADGATYTKDLFPAAQRFFHGFMVKSVVPWDGHPGMIHVNYYSKTLPEPLFKDDQWDWGDCGSRAILDWIYLREMTGDKAFGLQTELGERAMLAHILAPDTGMVYVPTASKPEEGTYYYHIWDQNRTLTTLVAMWQTETYQTIKAVLKTRTDKMITGLSQAATRGNDPKYGPYAIYPYDGGKSKLVNTIPCPAGGPLIEPLTKYWVATGNEATRKFLDELVAGVFSGKEDHYSVFEQDGSFYGHFHGHIATALGIARYGKALYEKGEKTRGLELLQWAKKVYDWTISPNNINAGSSWGWFPENVGDQQSIKECAEVCCVADMVEYAGLLASCATLDESLKDWDALWDHVERYTVNSILPTQFVITEDYKTALKAAETVKPAAGHSLDADLAIAERIDGGWVALFMPNELCTRQPDGLVEQYTGGCCGYSGGRALYACWRSAVADDGQAAQIRLPICRKSKALTQTVTEGPDLVRQEIKLQQPRLLSVRVPDWADISKVKVTNAKGVRLPYSVKERWLQFGKQKADTSICITYPLIMRLSNEKVGGSGKSMDFSPASEKRTFTAVYWGNRVIGMQPKADVFPIFPMK